MENLMCHLHSTDWYCLKSFFGSIHVCTCSPVLDLRLTLLALFSISLLVPPLSSSCELFGSYYSVLEGLSIRGGGHGGFGDSGVSIFGCRTSWRGGRGGCGNWSSADYFLCMFLDPLKAGLEGCNVLFERSLVERWNDMLMNSGLFLRVSVAILLVVN